MRHRRDPAGVRRVAQEIGRASPLGRPTVRQPDARTPLTHNRPPEVHRTTWAGSSVPPVIWSDRAWIHGVAWNWSRSRRYAASRRSGAGATAFGGRRG